MAITVRICSMVLTVSTLGLLWFCTKFCLCFHFRFSLGPLRSDLYRILFCIAGSRSGGWPWLRRGMDGEVGGSEKGSGRGKFDLRRHRRSRFKSGAMRSPRATLGSEGSAIRGSGWQRSRAMGVVGSSHVEEQWRRLCNARGRGRGGGFQMGV